MEKLYCFEPLYKILLYSYTYLKSLTIDTIISIKVKLDTASVLKANIKILYEKIYLWGNLINNKLEGFIQLSINNKESHYFIYK